MNNINIIIINIIIINIITINIIIILKFSFQSIYKKFINIVAKS
jgi:hypothetical protein